MSVAVNYRIDGPDDGEPVVLSGSIGSDLRMWEPQVPPLTAAGYRVLRYDHRGHGGSPVPAGPYTLAELAGDALALLDRLGIERAHWVGLSLGGMTGMWLGENAAERVRSLTLVCTSADLSMVDWDERGQAVRANGMGPTAASSMGRWFTAEWRTANPELVRHYSGMIAAQSVEGYVSCCAAIGSMDIADGLSDIGAPTLVISGAQDVGTPPAHGRRMAAAIPGARIEIVDPAAHLANVEAADEVSELILRHLKEVR